MPWGAAIGAAGSIIGGAISQSGAQGSAGQMQNAVGTWTKEAQAQLDRATSQENPYLAADSSAIAPLTNNLSSYTAQFAPTQAALEATPGYQFNLSQGTKAVQNSATAAGLGVSGPALQAGTNYASGLASTTYNQQLQNYLGQNQQDYNMLTGMVNQGTQGALQQGNQITGTGQAIAGFGMQGAGASGAYNAMGANAFGSSLATGTAPVASAFAPGGAGSSITGGGALGSLASGVGSLFSTGNPAYTPNNITGPGGTLGGGT
jgi:hypothetical protein